MGHSGDQLRAPPVLFFLFLTLVTGPKRSLSLKLSDTRVYEPSIRARLGTAAHLCEVVVLKLRTRVRLPPRRRANTAHIRQSRPDFGLGFQVKVVKTFEVVPSWQVPARVRIGAGGRQAGLHPQP